MMMVMFEISAPGPSMSRILFSCNGESFCISSDYHKTLLMQPDSIPPDLVECSSSVPMSSSLPYVC